MATKLCIAGKNQIAVDVLTAATALPDVTVLCLPTASDRGSQEWQPSLFAAATHAEIPIVPLEALYEEPDLVFLSVEYDRIIRPDKFRQPERLFNLHFSLLPAYRGCNTSVWPILNGEKEHGVTLHVIDRGVDTGGIIAQRRFEIGTRTARNLYFTCMSLGRDLCVDYLPRLLNGDFVAEPQRLDEGSLYKRSDLNFARKIIDFNQPTANVLRQVRAFSFVEYQLPLVDGCAILAAREIAVNETAGSERSNNVIRRATADGMVELQITNALPVPAALQKSGH